MSTLLVIISILAFVGGMATADGAPQQAVVAGAACFFAILARIAQASEFHKVAQKDKSNNQEVPAAVN